MYDDWEDEEDGEYEEALRDEEVRDEDYDDYLNDYEYQRSLLSPWERLKDDVWTRVWSTALYRKWSDWKYRHEHGFNGDEIPF